MPEATHDLASSFNDDEIPMGKRKETIAKDPALTVKRRRLATIEQVPHKYPGGRRDREASLLGFTEGQITSEMARRWKFPQSIIDALEHSGDPLAVRPFCRLSGVLHLAELLSTTDAEASEEMVDVPQALLVALHLDREWLTAHMTEAREFAASATVH